ncbi:DUF899 domain-containing protein [Actinokineospora globicatena]|uniref:DUF899 domain-containing protein n=1 Tax=Actinokineospora globicatena TaxID=103729 RepID=UPI0020A56C5C|nr:DUF899 family protein [Actinokineospora globicatena]MCP2303670.1 putative dithiol-disulfide oxidoreductase, DUF899 family [Actinokineospora globicatena]GLW79192.1 hypothetical protein Aglo01_36740 [Actinokineospora globicatena]GLW86398.1 hypothetical protein Aglo02_40370 [Actinokineospora globicatena]
MNRPPVVSQQEWQAARDELLVKEKVLTHALDALAAERRRLPMFQVRADHRFTAPDGGTVDFAALFDGKRQLVVYHFMLPAGADSICGGCATFTDNIPDLPHLAARDTRLILMAPAPQDEIEPVRARFGWTTPWYSSHGNGLYEEIGLGGGFALSVFLRDGDDIFRTYATTSRGVDRLRTDFNLLDLTPYGRQEAWEDSPEGWPQTPTMQWLRLRDEY